MMDQDSQDTSSSTFQSPTRGPRARDEVEIVDYTRSVGIDWTGLKCSFSDDWTKSREVPVMGNRWTAMTTFRTVEFVDDRCGGDQRRQRDRVGQPPSTPSRARVSWADLDVE